MQVVLIRLSVLVPDASKKAPASLLLYPSEPRRMSQSIVLLALLLWVPPCSSIFQGFLLCSCTHPRAFQNPTGLCFSCHREAPSMIDACVEHDRNVVIRVAAVPCRNPLGNTNSNQLLATGGGDVARLTTRTTLYQGMAGSPRLHCYALAHSPYAPGDIHMPTW